MRLIEGVEALAERHDGLLLDQFGVLHDGLRAFPEAVAALRLLRERRRRVVILSNSGRRAAPNRQRLAGLGIGPELYDDLVSSGEVAWAEMRAGDDALRGLGRSCLFISRGGDRSAVLGTDLDLVEAPEQARFVYLCGIDPGEAPRARVQALLDHALATELPLLCTNPDRISFEGPELQVGPGEFARRYAQAGGKVLWIGKPWPAIYRFGLQAIGLPPSRVVAVGDSLEHDIAGAAAAGIDSAFVLDGIHATAFAGIEGEAEIAAAVAGLLRDGGARPTFVMRRFGLRSGG